MPQILQGSGQPTYKQFFADVIRGLGGTPTVGAEDALAGIVRTEGINHYWNPFNIEWHRGDPRAYKGLSAVNSVGVQRYGSYDQGVHSTVAFLKDNPHWAPVIRAVKSGNYKTVNEALTHAYSWTTFKIATLSEAKTILGERISGPTRWS